MAFSAGTDAGSAGGTASRLGNAAPSATLRISAAEIPASSFFGLNPVRFSVSPNGSALPDVTPADIAATLTALLGRPVTVMEAPLDAVVPTFVSFGMSPHMAEIYREMHAGFMGGGVAWEGTGERTRGSIGLEEGLRVMLS